jgi:hypothetical protein
MNYGHGMDASPGAPFSVTPTHQALMDSVYNGCLLREVNYGQIFPQLAQLQGADEFAFDMLSSGVSDMLSG